MDNKLGSDRGSHLLQIGPAASVPDKAEKGPGFDSGQDAAPTFEEKTTGAYAPVAFTLFFTLLSAQEPNVPTRGAGSLRRG